MLVCVGFCISVYEGFSGGACFWAKNGGRFYGGILGSLDFGLKTRVGLEKKSKN
jgi:hypothetical protein